MLHVSRGGPWKESFGFGLGAAGILLILLTVFLSVFLAVAFFGAVAVFLISIAALIAVPCALVLGTCGMLRWVDWYVENETKKTEDIEDIADCYR